MRILIVSMLASLCFFSTLAFADSQRPSVVENVRANGASGAIIVSWNLASDNVGVDGYNIYRDGGYYKTVGNTSSYTDRSISSGRQYQYAVVAFDRARNYSSKSASASALSGGGASTSSANTTEAPTASGKPAAPNGLKVSVQSSSSARVSWNAPSGGAEGYNVYRNGSYYATVKGRTDYTAGSLDKNLSYTFQVVAFRNKSYSTKSASVSVSTSSGGTSSGGTSSSSADTSSAGNTSPPPRVSSSSKPAAPGGVKAQVQDSSSAKLSWNAPSGGAEGYNVYKDGQYFTTVKGRNEYIAGSLDSNRSYSFQLVAFRGGKYSTKSSSVSVQTGSGGSGSSQGAADSAPPPPANESAKSGVPNGYKQVFNDEFDRSSVNSSKWNTRYRWGPNWIVNSEKQYYIDTLNNSNFGASPFRHGGGRLTIQATRTPSNLRDKANNQKYLSGAMTTHNKFKMKYGYVEMRARLPKGSGLWPAFWLLHEANNKNRPEIDVMEMLGDNTRRVYQTYHYYDNGNLRSTPSYTASGPDYSGDFHTFGMLWEPGRISWYVDGVRTNRYESSKVSDESMYLLVNLAVGGAWAGSPNSSTGFPANFDIDYVRAYQKR